MIVLKCPKSGKVLMWLILDPQEYGNIISSDITADNDFEGSNNKRATIEFTYGLEIIKYGLLVCRIRS